MNKKCTEVNAQIHVRKSKEYLKHGNLINMSDYNKAMIKENKKEEK